MKNRSWFERGMGAAHCMLLGALLCASSAMGQAAAPVAPQITQPVDASQRKVFAHTVSPLVTSANDLGRADASLAMKDMVLLLHPSADRMAALKSFVEQLHNPNSPSYHKWLTPEQYAAKFGVGDADVKSVNDWLSSNGFKVEQVSRSKAWIRFSGTASQAETAFQTQIHKYGLNGETKYANATNLSIPVALTPAVTGVVSMNSFRSNPLHSSMSTIARNQSGKLVRLTDTSTPSASTTATRGGASPAFTYTGDQTVNYIAPGDFSKIYDAQSVVSSGTDGSGISVAVVGRSDISLSDVEAFRTISGLAANDPNVIYAGDDPGDVEGDDLEASLDVEWAGAIAPKAKVNYVIGASTSTTDGADLSAAYIVDNVVSPIATMSFGLCEALMTDTQISFYHLLWQQAAAEGITVFVASGDSGASGCTNPGYREAVYGFGVSGLASTPYNVAVGGTEFNDGDLATYWNLNNANDQSSAKGYIPEATWNESCDPLIPATATNCLYPPYEAYSYAGGGGASSCVTRTTDDSGTEYCAAGYAKPSWQAAGGVPQDGVRDVPDVSLAAAAEHDPYFFCYDGDCQWTTGSDGSITLQSAGIVGGTSAATPSMASIMALVEQKQGAFQGVANYELYHLAQAQGGSCDSSKRIDPTQSGTCVFNDITQGSNAISCSSGGQDCQGEDTPVIVGQSLGAPLFFGDSVMDGYSATAGYDPSSGLGSVDVANLVNSWGSLTMGSSTTTLSLSQTTFPHGTPVTVSGTVSGVSSSSVPTGEVSINATGTGGVQDVALSGGAFNGSVNNLPGGTYTVTAQYSGDINNAPSTSTPVSVTIAPEAANLVGTSYAYSVVRFGGAQKIIETDQSKMGSSFWLQFQVVGAYSGLTNATGTVKLSQGGKLIGTYPVDNQAGEIYVQCGPLTNCDYTTGNYTFTAEYSGDSSYKPSTGTLDFTIIQGNVRLYTTADDATPPPGGLVTAEVSFDNDPLFPPTGTVILQRSDTGDTLGTGTLDKNGIAYIPFHAPDGSYNLVGQYNGDANYNASTQGPSQGISTTDNGGTNPVNVTLSLVGSSFGLGQRTATTVSVQPSKQGTTGTPTGTVILYSSINQIDALTGHNSGQITGQWTLSGGKASGTVEWDLVGAQNIYAVYYGDGGYAGGNSTPVTVTVAQATPTVVVQPLANFVPVGGQASVTALLASSLAASGVPAPTGTIQFFDSLNGGAAQAIGTPQLVNIGNGNSLLATLAPALPTGSNVITAVYSGDANWKSATSAPTSPILVTSPDYTVTAPTDPLQVTAGEAASLTVTTQSILGYNAPITLSCGGTLPEGVTCNTATVIPGATGTVTLTTVAPGVSSASTASLHSTLWAVSGTASLAGLFLLCVPRRRRFYPLAVMLLAAGIAAVVSGCGGGSGGAKPTTVSLTSSNTKVASGAGLSLQATVQSTNPLTGTVTFYDAGQAIGNAVSVTDGVASLQTSSLTVGTHAITAKYSGDNANTGSSSSDVLEQTVTGSFTVVVNATSGSESHTVNIPVSLQ